MVEIGITIEDHLLRGGVGISHPLGMGIKGMAIRGEGGDLLVQDSIEQGEGEGMMMGMEGTGIGEIGEGGEEIGVQEEEAEGEVTGMTEEEEIEGMREVVRG